MSKKNLDKLFQEKLNNFSELPDDKVWQAIETSLDKKKKRRLIVPIWWKLGGVAAVLLLGFFIYNSFQNEQTSINTSVSTKGDSNIKNSEKNQEIVPSKNTFEKAVAPNKNEVVIEEHQIIKGAESSSKAQNTSPSNNANNSLNSAVSLAQSKAAPKNTIDQENNVTTKLTPSSIPHNGNNVVVAAEKEKNKTSLSSEINTLEEESVLVQNEEKNTNSSTDTTKKSIYDVIAEKESKETLAENQSGRWSAGPSIAPVYYDAMGQGSPVHSIFVPNAKSGDINLSYGLSVAYEVNKKLSIRSGIHKVDYGYNTDDIEFSSSLNPAADTRIANIDFALTASNLIVSSTTNNAIQALNQNPFLNTSEISATTPNRNGSMQQQLGYIEVPVELKYALIDKRIGFNVIGGVSSLFLVDNSISLSSGNLTTNVGEANNVNAVNFSTNVGFGINYKFSPKIKFNVEPMFKYQLNTFSETEGTFQPFSVGVYSGLTFKF